MKYRNPKFIRIVLSPTMIEVGRALGLDPRLILSKRRHPDCVLARMLVMRIAKERHGFGLSDIGRALGMHHTTVLHGQRTMEELMITDERVQDIVARVNAKLSKPYRLEETDVVSGGVPEGGLQELTLSEGVFQDKMEDTESNDLSLSDVSTVASYDMDERTEEA